MAIKLQACRNLIKRFHKLDADKIMQATLKSSTSLQQDILDLNRQDQLYDQGIAADGKFLGDYSAVTIEGTSTFQGKKQKGQRYDHITLNDTGAFYESFKLDIEAQQSIITADTQKPDVDLMTYGNILGLTPQSKQRMIDWIRPIFVQKFREAVFK